MLDAVALTAAVRLERSVGPQWALASYRRLLDAGDAAVVEGAARGALRCAVALDDNDALAGLCARWPALAGGDLLADVMRHAVALLTRGWREPAGALAEAEAQRAPCARASYLAARCREEAGHAAAALTWYERAFEQASVEPADRPVQAAAGARWLDHLLDTVEGRTRAAALADLIDPTLASPAARLVIARARLCHPSKFRRAAALSLLEELGREAERDANRPERRSAVGREAIRAAARHADQTAGTLSWVERERVEATLAHWPHAGERDAALCRLALRQRLAASEGTAGFAEALAESAEVLRVLGGTTERLARLLPDAEVAMLAARAHEAPADGSGGRAHLDAASCALGELGLEVVEALVAGRHEHAAARLADVQVGQGALVPAPLWTAAHLALGCTDARVTRAGLGLVEQLTLCTHAAPPRGFLALAAALTPWQNERPGLCLLALRGAVARGEPGAREALCRALSARGWAAAGEGARDRAIPLLEEAKRLAQ